jgi:hypothetical protein
VWPENVFHFLCNVCNQNIFFPTTEEYSIERVTLYVLSYRHHITWPLFLCDFRYNKLNLKLHTITFQVNTFNRSRIVACERTDLQKRADFVFNFRCNRGKIT